MSKTFFLYHVVKEKEKISGNHFVPSVGIFINLPDCACIKKLFSHPVQEEEFLNFDCSVSHKSPSLPGVPPPLRGWQMISALFTLLQWAECAFAPAY